MPQLKDETTVEDVRLDRLVDFDERSRSFPIRVGIPKRPRSYTWGCDGWLDQGAEGACVGFAFAHELIAAPAKVSGILAAQARDIYHEAQRIDAWPGGSYAGAVPFYEGTSVLAGAKVALAKGYCESYRWAFGLDDLILGVGRNGPAVIGVNWYEGMFNPDAKGFLQVSGQLAGGHAILVRGVNVKRGFFTLRNSWGRGWGKDGDCYITFDDMRRLLAERGEAVFLVKRKSKPA